MRQLAFTIIIVALSSCLYAQNVGIGTTTPYPSAILELKSSTKGFLLPRMTTSKRDSILAPVVGLKIFNTDDQCEDTYDGLKWLKNCALKHNTNVTIPGNTWEQEFTLPGTNASGCISFVVNGKAYVGLGSLGAVMYEYNPTPGIWTQKANFPPGARTDAIGFSIGDKGYVTTGRDVASGDFRKDLWEYNPATNVWTQKTDFIGDTRVAATGFTVNGKAYIGMGYVDPLFGTTDFYAYDPVANSWSAIANAPYSHTRYAVGFAINDKGYIGTGAHANGTLGNQFYEYNPTTNIWTQKVNFGGTARRDAVGFSINGKGYIGTGFDGIARKDFWQYDPVANNWTQKADYGGIPLQEAVGFAINNVGYIGSGIGSNDFWAYNTIVATGSEYIENIPSDVASYKGFAWTREVDQLYTTQNPVTATIRGDLKVNENATIGETTSFNLLIGNNNRIQANNNGTTSTLILQEQGGNVQLGNVVSEVQVMGNQKILGGGGEVPLLVSGGTDATHIENTGFLTDGSSSGALVIDDNEIQVRGVSGSTASLNFQQHGGDIFLGNSSSSNKILSNNEVTNSSTNAPLVIGVTNSPNLAFDNDEIQARNNGIASTLSLQEQGGNLEIGLAGSVSYTNILGAEDASPTLNGILVVGPISSTNIVLDRNEIMARNNGIVDNLSLQANGGDLLIGSSTSLIDINGALIVNDSVGIGTSSPDMRLSVNGNASKTGGGSWAAFSDRRLKNDVSKYNDGLQDILKINPVRYKYNNKSEYDTTQYHIGIIAQELQKIAPYMVSTSKKIFKDGSTDYLSVDNSAMTYMLINAVKELAKENEELKIKSEKLRINNEELVVKNDTQTNDINHLKSEIENIKQLLISSSIVKK